MLLFLTGNNQLNCTRATDSGTFESNNEYSFFNVISKSEVMEDADQMTETGEHRSMKIKRMSAVRKSITRTKQKLTEDLTIKSPFPTKSTNLIQNAWN